LQAAYQNFENGGLQNHGRWARRGAARRAEAAEVFL